MPRVSSTKVPATPGLARAHRLRKPQDRILELLADGRPRSRAQIATTASVVEASLVDYLGAEDPSVRAKNDKGKFISLLTLQYVQSAKRVVDGRRVLVYSITEPGRQWLAERSNQFPVAKVADSKGRVALGPRFADKTVIVQDVDETEVRVMLAAVVPQREMWLHKNSQARASVEKGLAQARAGRLTKLDPDADATLLSKLDD